MESEDAAKRKRTSLFRRALLNQYNYILLGSTALFSLATGSVLPAIVGAGAEVLWLVLGPDTVPFRKWVAKQEAREEKQRLAAEMAALIAGLGEGYRDRYDALAALANEITGLAGENHSLEASLLQDEMAKLDQLLQSFLRMAASHQRLGQYLRENPIAEVERDITRAQRSLKQEDDARVQASLKQALSLAQRRLAKHQQIEGTWKALSVQMETLEKSFDYLKSHILGMGTHEELASALNDLVTGVASVSEIEASAAELGDELRAGAAASRLAAVGDKR